MPTQINSKKTKYSKTSDKVERRTRKPSPFVDSGAIIGAACRQKRLIPPTLTPASAPKEPGRDVIEQVRMLKGRNIPPTQIAKCVGISEEDVERILESLSETINLDSELVSLVDTSDCVKTQFGD
jgi:DNA-directed RNA polymerase specialized sigma subunit